jgi:hypothetical protein
MPFTVINYRTSLTPVRLARFSLVFHSPPVAEPRDPAGASSAEDALEFVNPRVPSNKPFGARRSVVAEAPSPRVASSRHGTRSIAMAESSHGVGPDGMKKRDEDSDDGVEFSPFWGIEKGAVLQEARCFNESQLDARKCQQVITKLLYLTNQGETFTKVSAAPGPRSAPAIPSEPAAPVAADGGGVRAGRILIARSRGFFRAPRARPPRSSLTEGVVPSPPSPLPFPRRPRPRRCSSP